MGWNQDRRKHETGPQDSKPERRVLPVQRTAHGEYFLPYEEYPWFKEARIADIINVELLHDFHIHWPGLDVDLSLASLEDPSKTPLVYRP